MLQYRASLAPPVCPRRRMIALIVGATGLIAILLTGLVLSLIPGPHRPGDTDTRGRPAPKSSPAQQRPGPVSASIAAARNGLAEKRMPDTGTGGAYGPQVSTRDPGAPLVLPSGARVGAWGVVTGYPRTPQGALAQLAAIDVAAFRSASLPGVRAVIGSWAAPGGPDQKTWSGVKAMATLLENAGIPASGSAVLSLRARPVMGLIKGTVGTDFVIPCVGFTIDITLGGGTARQPAVDCQRMIWDGRGWLIGPGDEPAPAPSVWPGTDAAIDAGYQELRPAGTSPEAAIG